MRPEYDLHEFVFPVISIKNSDTNFLGLWGTCFYIGENVYITAKHVIESAKTSVDAGFSDHLCIGQPEEEKDGLREWVFSTFEEYELHPRLDFAIFKVPDNFEKIRPLTWKQEGLNIFDDVLTTGYPYSLDLTNKVINIRGLKGHIIGTGKQIEGSVSYQSYELSFNPPRGLSGGPLCSRDSMPIVSGIIIGNRTHEMEVLNLEEITTDGKLIEIYTKSEMMHIGIAIQATEILYERFSLINGTIKDHLLKNRLLV